MTGKHLTSEQLDSLLRSKDNEETKLHLAQCPLCAEEYNALREVLQDLRNASQSLATDQLHHKPLPSIMPQRPRIALWAMAAAAIAMLAAIPSLHHGVQQTPSPSAPIAAMKHANPAEDEALLNSIESDLSANVPDAMEPLATSSQETTTAVSTTRKN